MDIQAVQRALDAVSSATTDGPSGTGRRRTMTCITVAHRLAAVRDADRIYFVRDGRVLESGTHDELLADGASSSAYARLMRSQLQQQQQMEPTQTEAEGPHPHPPQKKKPYQEAGDCDENKI